MNTEESPGIPPENGEQGTPEMNDPGAPVTDDRETRQWAMFLHLSQLAGFLVPFAGLIAPIIIWQLKKEAMPLLDVHGKIVVNWIISMVIYFIVSGILTIVLIGIPLMIVLGLIGIAFPIIGGIKANNGEVWKYPLSINFLK